MHSLDNSEARVIEGAVGSTRSTAWRARLEHTLHAIAALGLVAALLLTWALIYMRPEVVQVQGTEALRGALVRWSTDETPRRIHAQLTTPPDRSTRDWLSALRGVGTAVSWEGQQLLATGMAVEPVADPKHPLRIWLSAPMTTPITVGDALGVIARVPEGSTDRSHPTGDADEARQLAVIAPSLSRVVRMQAGTAQSATSVRDTLELKPLLLLGQAGWEAKYVVAALEEWGWKVDSRLRLAPKQVVVQGPSVPVIDTDHYAAVIVLDGSAADMQAIASYVRRGGGLLVLGEAARLRSLTDLLPARRLGRPIAAQSFEAADDETPAPPLDALELLPLEQLAEDAVILERRAEHVTLAARRVEQGRVLQVGYVDSWRWRLGARDADAVDAHRRWWSQLVSQVAYAPRSDRTMSQEERITQDPAPLASLHAALGAATTVEPSNRHRFLNKDLLPLLFALITLALFSAWASRRLRGQS